MSDQRCDVCLFTSVPDEFLAARRVFERIGRLTFKAEFTEQGREVFSTTMKNSAGEELSVQLSSLPEMGGTNATMHILPILQQYLPRFSCMSGICAGDREKVMLGDLIVATRAYEYEAGKVVLHDGKAQLLHDVKTSSPDTNIIGYANLFEDWKADVNGLVRPLSKRQQRDWLLFKLHAEGQRLADLDPKELEQSTPRWRSIVDEMEEGAKPLLAADGSLTGEAVQRIKRFGQPFLDRPQPEQFPMVMGSGRAVRSDNPFPTLREPERKLIALDMEASSLYQAVEAIASLGKRSLVVKGVSDYGDEDKDDSYRQYASEASAVYLFHFIRRYVTHTLMPRMTPRSGNRKTAPVKSASRVGPEERQEFTSLELETALAGNDPVASQSAFESILRQKVDPIPFLVTVLESLDQEYLSFPLTYTLPRQFGAAGRGSIAPLLQILKTLEQHNHWFAAIEAARCFRFLPRDEAGNALATLFRSNDADVLRCAIAGLGWLGHWEWSHRIRQAAFEDDDYAFEKLHPFALEAAMRMLAFSSSIEVAHQQCTKVEDWITSIRERQRLETGEILRRWNPISFYLSAQAADVILNRWLKDSDELYLSLAIASAKNSRLPRSVARLLQILQNQRVSTEVRMSAAVALAEIGSEKVSTACTALWQQSCASTPTWLSDTCRGLLVACSTTMGSVASSFRDSMEQHFLTNGWGCFKSYALYSGAGDVSASVNLSHHLDSDDPELRGATSIALAISQGKAALPSLEDRIPQMSTPLERLLTYSALQRLTKGQYGDELHRELCQYPETASPSILLKVAFLWRREFVYGLSLQNKMGKARSAAWGDLLGVRRSDLASMASNRIRTR